MCECVPSGPRQAQPETFSVQRPLKLTALRGIWQTFAQKHHEIVLKLLSAFTRDHSQNGNRKDVEMGDS